MLKSHLIQFKLVSKVLIACALSFCVPVIQAATVHSIKPNNDPVQLSNNKSNTFTDLSLDLLRSDAENLLSLPPSAIKTKTEAEALVISKTTKPSARYTGRSFRTKLMSQYGDSALVQNSLNSLYEIKNLWSEVDALAYDFSYDVLETLDLNQVVQGDFNKQQNPQSFQHKKVNHNIYDKIKRIQKSKNKTSLGYNEDLGDNIFSHLLRKQTLYYLFTLFILVSLLKRLTRFILRLFP